jgi:TatA/E family protein of Tat protein translocase
MPFRAVARFRRFALHAIDLLRNREVAMFGIGQWELLLIVLVMFILFGHRLPGLMRSAAEGIKAFQGGLSGEDQPARETLK